MGAPIALRRDYDGAALCRLAKASDDANQTRRLLALAVIYDGSSRRAAALVGGQDLRKDVLAFHETRPGNYENLQPIEREKIPHAD